MLVELASSGKSPSFCATFGYGSRCDGVAQSVAFHPMTQPEIETFPNPNPNRDYSIDIDCPEFTSVCPRTGQPDFGTIRISYVPDRSCIELKALKYYLQSFRQQGIFYEAVTNQILDDLVAACGPKQMTVSGDFSARGGITTVVTARHP